MFVCAGYHVFWVLLHKYNTIIKNLSEDVNCKTIHTLKYLNSWYTTYTKWNYTGSQNENSDLLVHADMHIHTKHIYSSFQFCFKDIVKGSWVEKEKGTGSYFSFRDMYKTQITTKTIDWEYIMWITWEDVSHGLMSIKSTQLDVLYSMKLSSPPLYHQGIEH